MTPLNQIINQTVSINSPYVSLNAKYSRICYKQDPIINIIKYGGETPSQPPGAYDLCKSYYKYGSMFRLPSICL